MRKYRLSLIFYPQDTGGYTVVCPELRGCFSDGRTFEEAESNIKELLSDCLARETSDETDADLLAEGLAVQGKVFKELEIEA